MPDDPFVLALHDVCSAWPALLPPNRVPVSQGVADNLKIARPGGASGYWDPSETPYMVLPTDLLGASIYNQRSQEFVIHKGPIFTNILLADEIEDVCFIDAPETRITGKLMPGWARVADAMIEHEGYSLLVVDPSHFITLPAQRAA